MIFSNTSSLATSIAKRAESTRLIAVDGKAGVGKTTLAIELANALEGTAVDLDDFLEKDTGKFLAALQVPKLREALAVADPPVVVSGVCVLSALEKLRLIPDVHIYIKRMAAWGWADEDELLGNQIEQFEAMGFPAHVLVHEVYDYHRTYRPDERATHVYERPNTGSRG